VGVFPLSANPIHWGHIIVSLYAISELALDLMVLLPAGRIDYKSFADRDNVEERHRHFMVQKVTRLLYPIVLYTDVALGTNAPGECAVHDLRRLNYGRNLDFVLVWGAENEARVRRIISQTLDCLRYQSDLGPDSTHSLALTFLNGIGGRSGPLDIESLSIYQNQIGLRLPCRVVTIKMPELAPFRSTAYREHCNPALVPRAVHQYVLEHRLYV
jgi:nicotinic acid mononucleotide adenylyltransferase